MSSSLLLLGLRLFLKLGPTTADMPSWLTAWLSPWDLLAVCIYSVLCWAGRYMHRYMHLPFYSILALVWLSVTHLLSPASKDQKWRQWLDVHCVLSVHTGPRMVVYTYSKVPIGLQTGTTPCKWEPASQAAILFGVNQWYLCLADWCTRWFRPVESRQIKVIESEVFQRQENFLKLLSFDSELSHSKHTDSFLLYRAVRGESWITSNVFLSALVCCTDPFTVMSRSLARSAKACEL